MMTMMTRIFCGGRSTKERERETQGGCAKAFQHSSLLDPVFLFVVVLHAALLMQPKNPEEMVEGGTVAYVSSQCFQMLRTVAELLINWQPNGSILIGHQLSVVSVYSISNGL